MNREDRHTLNSLLWDLLSAQDDVTHYNEKGPDYAEETRLAIAERNAIKQRLIEFVEELEARNEQAP